MKQQDLQPQAENAVSGGIFPRTRWSLLIQAQQSDSAGARQALEKLCEVYWYPIYVMTRHKHGMAHHDAQDRTQSFWCWFLEKGHVAQARMEAGKFRSFLMGYLDHFLQNEWRKDFAAKRGGRIVHISKDSDEWNERFESEMGHHPSPEQHLDAVWKQAALEIAYREVQASWLGAGRGELFEVLKDHAKAGSPRGAYEAIASRFGLTQENVRQYSSQWKRDIRAAIDDWRERA